MEQNALYRSFEEYATARLEKGADAIFGGVAGHSESIRSYAAKARKKIEIMTGALGITLELFKPSGSYLMTRGCSELFDCLLDGYEGEYGKIIRKGTFSDLPDSFLIQVRALLFDALRDAGISNEEIQAELRYFETRTDCPKRLIAKKLSEPVAEAVALCRKQIQATEAEWDMVADCVELQYLGEVRPLLMKFLVKNIREQLDINRNSDSKLSQV